MAPSARGIIIEIIGDAKSYIRAAEQSVAATLKIGQSSKTLATRTITANESISASNTALAGSYGQIAVDANLAAKASVAASLKSTEAIQAQVVAYRQLATSATASAAVRERAAVLGTAAETQLARSQGLVVASSRKMSGAVKEGERDLNKLVRGGLAGSGALSALGRSLAFASTGFIAFATGATVIKESISAAQDEAVAQKQVARQLQTSGKSWQQYGGQIDSVLLKESHLAGFTKAELLQAFGFLVRVGGNVQNSLKLTGLAADVARGRGISLQAASIALSKALGGSATALRRLGIIVPKNVSTTQALAFVTAKFAGQAEAGTTAADKFHATLVDTGAVIGRELLPTFNRLATGLANWLAKMNESGRLQRDVNAAVSIAGDVFHTLGDAIHFVDDVTGGFKRTLELLIGLQFAKIAATWVTELRVLATTWGLVGGAATEAGAAQTAALAGAGAASRGGLAVEGAAAGGFLSGGLAGRLANRARFGPPSAAARNIAMYTEGAAASGAAAATASGKIAKLGSNIGLVGIAAAIAIPRLQKLGRGESAFVGRHLGGTARDIFDRGLGIIAPGVLGKNPFSGILGGDSKPVPVKVVNQPTLGQHNLLSEAASTPQGRAGRRGGPAIFTSFTDTITNQLAQARAALTKSTQDDVRAAKAEIAFIRREIAAGHLRGKSLVEALGAEASALSTIWSAEQAAAQKRAAAAQAARDRIIKQIENAIDPLKLEVALSRAQAFGQPILPRLKALLAAAYKGLARAIAAGNLQLEKQALDQITSLKQQIKDAATQASVVFSAPAKLQLALARDQALGIDQTRDLLKLRKLILKFIRTHKKNTQALIDAYNQLAQVNEQLGSQASSALGLFKQASTKALTEGLGLTAEQRRRLRARLSQLGPGQTVPGEGVGAAGFAIDPETGRPIERNRGRRGRRRRLQATDGGGPQPIVIHDDINVYLDGKQLESTVTRHQQRRGRRNPSQRRGPNAGG